MAGQSVMSTPIFDELLREMSAGAAEDPAEDTADEAGQQSEAGGRRRRSP